MEVTCCFQKLGGGVCASDKRYEGAVIVPLSSCQKDILGHTRSIGVSAINSEVELAINIFSSARHFVLDHLPIPSFFPWAFAGAEVLIDAEYRQGYQSMLLEEKRERRRVE